MNIQKSKLAMIEPAAAYNYMQSTVPTEPYMRVRAHILTSP
jgi:hypothetical protein